MPEEYWLVFQIVMGETVDTKDHNTLDLEVFRETTKRNDNLLADKSVSQYFDIKFNWQVQQNENSSIWGIPDTVRSVMNMQTPVSLIINYTGSAYDNASEDELTYVLNSLFNLRAEDGSFIYRNIVSPDLCVVKDNECKLPRDKDNYPIELYATEGEYWKAKGFTLTGEANSERLFTDYPRQKGDYEHFEYWEQQVFTCDDFMSAEISTGTWSLVTIGSCHQEWDYDDEGNWVLVGYDCHGENDNHTNMGPYSHKLQFGDARWAMNGSIHHESMEMENFPHFDTWNNDDKEEFVMYQTQSFSIDTDSSVSIFSAGWNCYDYDADGVDDDCWGNSPGLYIYHDEDLIASNDASINGTGRTSG